MPDSRSSPRSSHRALGCAILGLAGLGALLLGGLVAVRIFWLEPFRIPAASMVPELTVGEIILVDKRFGAIARGDVVVFRYPPDPSVDYVKRVIGLPGEEVELRANVVYIDGQPLPTTALGELTWTDAECVRAEAELYREGAEGRAWEVLRSSAAPAPVADFGPLAIPAGHYFVLGDNRDNSADSRFWGLVPAGNLVGVLSQSLIVPVRCGG